jgi:ribosomal protein S18 acetylase RimI-like enzyme
MSHASSLPFRDATHADVTAIVALVESAYRGDVSRKGWTTEADLLDGQRTDPEGVRALIDRPGSRVVLAERGGELVACAHIERHGESCYFGMFSVRPTTQGAGIGDQVLRECERIAAQEFACRRMDMTVIVQRAELIAWYERRGYARTGERKPFPYGDPRFGLPKRDDLEFIVLAKALTPI